MTGTSTPPRRGGSAYSLPVMEYALPHVFPLREPDVVVKKKTPRRKMVFWSILGVGVATLVSVGVAYSAGDSKPPSVTAQLSDKYGLSRVDVIGRPATLVTSTRDTQWQNYQGQAGGASPAQVAAQVEAFDDGAPGTYRVLAYGGEGSTAGVPRTCEVTVGGDMWVANVACGGEVLTAQ